MINSRSRWVAIAFLGVGIATLATPSHAGFLDKMKAKMDKVTSKVTDKTDKALAPVAEANQKAIDAQNQAMAPVVQGQQKMNELQQAAMSPAVRARQSADAMTSQVTRPLNGLFSKDAALRGFKINSLPSTDLKTLRLTGVVSNTAARMRAQQLATRQFPGRIVNEIRVVPKTTKAKAKASLNGR